MRADNAGEPASSASSASWWPISPVTKASQPAAFASAHSSLPAPEMTPTVRTGAPASAKRTGAPSAACTWAASSRAVIWHGKAPLRQYSPQGSMEERPRDAASASPTPPAALSRFVCAHTAGNAVLRQQIRRSAGHKRLQRQKR